MTGKEPLTMENKKLIHVMYYVLSFLIPAVIMFGALAGLKVTPFGDNSLAISDGNALYLNYVGYISKVLKGQEGILYSFTKGLGANMMGSWGWFLLNPLFALFAFTDVTNYMQMYTFVSVFSLCLCGLTMYVMLKDFYGHNADNLIFSTAYAMNGFLVANVFQINFFVDIPVLPIMVMGLRRILKGKSPVIYTVALAYGLFMNFYFGFMLCVASLLFFFVYLLIEWKNLENKKTVAIRYVVSSGLAGMMSAIVWLPALLSLRGGRLDQSLTNAITFKENMPFLDMFSKLFIGANSTAELSNGLPNIFVGIFPVFLVILFFINHSIPVSKKKAAAIILVFYLVSFYVTVFNIAMHGGTVTNWFNYRDSFIFCFIVLLIAAEEWQYFADEPLENIKRALVILVVASLIVFNKKFDYVSGTMVLLSLAILALILLAFYMHQIDPAKNTVRMLTMVVLVMMCLDQYLNYYFSVKNIMEWGHKESEYQEVVLPVSALVDAVHGYDKSFYRMEVGEQRSGTLGNDPMLYGYYGVGHGGSDDRDFVRLALSELGVHRYNMRNNYARGVSSATDSLLGLKYLISKDDIQSEKGYEKLVNIGEYSIYINPYVLPVGMVVNKDIEDVSINIEDVFYNLNNTWSAISGSSEKVFVEEEDIDFSSHNITDPITLSGKEAGKIVASRDEKLSLQISSDNISGSGENSSDSNASETVGKNADETWATSQEKPENTNYIKFTFTAGRDGAVYSYNRSGMTEDNGSIPHALNYEGYYHKGDEITGYIPIDSSVVTRYLLEEVAGRFKIAYLDEDALSKMSSLILDRPCILEKHGGRTLKGTFTAGNDQKLMFTIPYDEGWSLKIDGKDIKPEKVLDVFMAVDATPGEHFFEMKYVPIGLKEGAIVSSFGLILTITFSLRSVKRR